LLSARLSISRVLRQNSRPAFAGRNYGFCGSGMRSQAPTAGRAAAPASRRWR